MKYRVVLTKTAEKELYKLDKTQIKSISRVFDLMGKNPRPKGFKKMQGKVGFFRIRKGDLRIIYSIDDKEKIIVIAIIGNRKDVYK